jgi:hypothetical protein
LRLFAAELLSFGSTESASATFAVPATIAGRQSSEIDMTRSTLVLVCSSLVLVGGQVSAAPAGLSSAEETAAFAAAGFTRKGQEWRSACAMDDPGSPSYTPGAVDQVRDLNGDGRADVVIVEGGTFCYGMAGQGFSILAGEADGGWRPVTAAIGFPNFLKAKGVDGWPDIQVGGPGFCFPVLRWDGSSYALNRHQYQGKPCRPGR